jgi:hypothetical protein
MSKDVLINSLAENPFRPNTATNTTTPKLKSSNHLRTHFIQIIKRYDTIPHKTRKKRDKGREIQE